MKFLLILVIINLLIALIAASVEKRTSNNYTAYVAEHVKDVFGVATSMLSFWLIYCILC